MRPSPCLALCVALGFASFAVQPAQAQLGQFLYTWSVQGPTLGLALDPAQSVYVVSATPSVLVANKYTSLGQFLQAFNADYQVEAYGVGVLSDQGLVVADYYHTLLLRYAPNGSYIGSWWIGGVRSAYLAVDEFDNIYVTDDEGNRVRKFSKTGTLLGDWVADHPTGIAYFNGTLYVAARNSAKIQVFSSNGTPQGELPTGAIAGEQLSVDALGRLYLADWGGFQLFCYATNGDLLWSHDGHIAGYSGVVRYHSVVVTPEGTLFAGDYDHNSVLAFNLATPTATAPATWGSVKQRYR